eukprot:232641-Chlamydomonas_euryale.AAC.1
MADFGAAVRWKKAGAMESPHGEGKQGEQGADQGMVKVGEMVEEGVGAGLRLTSSGCSRA